MKPVMVSDGTMSGLKVLRIVLSFAFVFCVHKTWMGVQWAPVCKEQGGKWEMTECVMPNGSTWAPEWNEWTP